MAKKKKVTYWFGADVTELEKGMKRIENSAKRMSYSTARLGKIMSKNITAPIVGIGTLAIRESIAFESAFANVKKTVIGTEEQLKKLERGILKMSTTMPTSAKEIAEVAASAGQLGIETENVLGFTKAMIQLGETSNMSANEAADALARFSNITGMSQKDFDRLGSTIVALGNSLATTEREVVDMGLRLAGVGRQIGMTEPEILAFAGSLSSVGIEAQAGGTAFSRLMMNMKLATVNGGQSLKDFASIAGMTASQFKDQFEKDASGAIIKFIQGLAGLKGTGTSAIEVLEKMGITEIRMRDSILRATGASELFTKSLALGRKEWEQNNAMQKKTAEFYKTTEAQLKMLRNQVYLTGKEIGDTLTPSLVVAAEKLRDVVKAFSDLSPEIKTNIVEWGLAAAAIGPLLIMTSKAISGFKELLLNARKFTAFLSSNPALLAVAAMVGTYSAMDKSPEMQETLSERRGLGLNKRGKSAETQALRDLKALTTSVSSATNSLAAIKALDAAMSTATVKPLVATTVTTPVTTPILDDIGGSGKSGKGSTETALERQIKLAQQAGQETAFAIERMQKQEELQKEVMLAVQEGEAKFNEEMATLATDDARAALEALKLQVDIGNISFEQYRDGLEQLKTQFDGMPGAITEIDNAMKALDSSILASTRTLGSFVREAETALKDKLVGIPDTLSDAFAGAIAYGEDLGESLKQLAKEIAYTTLKAFILKSIFGGLGGLGGSIGTPASAVGLGNWVSAKSIFGRGGVFNSGQLTAFAQGGIVNKPTLFPFANGIGLMGEAGPEAIMPLKRTSSGDLGVQAEGGGGMTNITMNINAVDSKSFVEMMRTNRASVESIIVENIMRNGAVRGAIRGMA